ncbi:thiol:disulfide interchange protein [Eikenella sp. NML03-A-027]|uniref:DsbC family protein n=1 Tax=Eikenella sp. NML03-A-027 TaxID=1795828 RepID=UPI0007E11803|nr:DsbC family protein [Eikenella sp. NML03-A-027]OAM32448.1 thiol:disulfide interchange protein [Eikenella sp. NML03-A-027]
MKHTLSAILLAALLPLAACNAQPAVQQNASGTAASAAAAPAGSPEAVIRSKLTQTYGNQGLEVLSVTPAPVDNLYEVFLSGNQLVYMTGDGNHMFTGDLIDVNKRSNLSETRREELNRIDFAALPLDSAIKEVRGNGRLKVAVFSDPDCPFCRRLEKEFEQMTDITIYNFMMPIPDLHPAAEAKAVRIWCSPDRTAAWINWMRKGTVPPESAGCENPVKETMALGNHYGFNGTPTMVFPNGKVVPGYMPKDALQQALEANQK